MTALLKSLFFDDSNGKFQTMFSDVATVSVTVRVGVCVRVYGVRV